LQAVSGAFDLAITGMTKDTMLEDLACDYGSTNSSDCDGKSYICMFQEGGKDICWPTEAGFNTGDTAWMLCATTFVMLQTPVGV
jgi:hypothetical protein